MTQMRVFEVYLNGKKLFRAGIGDDGVLVTLVEHVMRSTRNETRLSVGGLISNEQHVTWGDRDLATGDEITIKITENGSVNRPRKRERRDQKHELKQQKAYVRGMAKQFGWKIVTNPPKKSK